VQRREGTIEEPVLEVEEEEAGRRGEGRRLDKVLSSSSISPTKGMIPACKEEAKLWIPSREDKIKRLVKLTLPRYNPMEN